MDIDLVALGTRARIARSRAGFSQRDIELKTGMSQSTLHRVETGKRTNVTLAEFDQLAQALDIGLDELLYGSAVQERVLAAARTKSCAESDLRAGLEQGIELLKLDDRLDAVVKNLRQESTLHTLDVPDHDDPYKRGRLTAEKMRTTLGLGIAPIADLVEAVELLTGVDVGTMPLPTGVSGLCATDPERATSIVLVNSRDVIERQRFTLAHELGHLLFGDATHVDAVDGQRSQHELLCDEFARHVLIPYDGVQTWLDRVVGTTDNADINERTIALIARHFGTSPKAAQIQLNRMNLLRGNLVNAELPSGRRWAYRYGWGPQFDSAQASAGQPRVPRRILDRATEAYRRGKLGLGVLARLQNRSASQVEQAFSEAGVVVETAVRRADISSLVKRASARKI